MIGEKEKDIRKIKYQELIKFFLPLAVMPIIIGIAHNAVNASLARLPFPEITLAVFAVSKSLTNNLKSPIHMARQTVTSLVDDHRRVFIFSNNCWFSLYTFRRNYF